MERRDGTLWLSPSDLSGHLGCAHLTTLALEAAEGLRVKPSITSPYTKMIFAKGDAHELAYRDQLIALGREVADVGFDQRDWAAGAARTAELMRAGADVIYQAPFAFAGWRGVADFLERIDEPSDLGDYSYEAVDTKLARTEMLPHHALQLCFYAAGIAQVQGRRPLRIHVELGSGEARVDPAVGDRLVRQSRQERHVARGRGPRRRRSRSRATTARSARSGRPASTVWEDSDHLSARRRAAARSPPAARGRGSDDARAARGRCRRGRSSQACGRRSSLR